MKIRLNAWFAFASLFLILTPLAKSLAQNLPSDSRAGGRERLLMDFGWRFAFGNATNPAEDWNKKIQAKPIKHYRCRTEIGTQSGLHQRFRMVESVS